MNSDLSSLARTLAERLHDVSIRCSHNNTESEWAFDCIKCTEWVIREAIEKTLEEARAIVIAIGDEYRERQSRETGEELDAAISMTISANTCAAAILSLKQSNSGRAEQGIVSEKTK